MGKGLNNDNSTFIGILTFINMINCMLTVELSMKKVITTGTGLFSSLMKLTLEHWS